MYIESSYPSVKGHKARLISRVTVPVRNCLKFWYFMYGNTTGRLNVYLLAKSFSSLGETLIWRVVGSRGNEWKKAEIPIDINYAYQVIHVLISRWRLWVPYHCWVRALGL